MARLDSKKHYLQIALNSTLEEARKIIPALPRSDRIILEAGTPLIKRYGIEAIRSIRLIYKQYLFGVPLGLPASRSRNGLSAMEYLWNSIKESSNSIKTSIEQQSNEPYIVADLKMMDRGATEVALAVEAGASAAVALGAAPIESLNAFVRQCNELNIDAMIDMMNVEYPLAVLRQLKVQPDVVILHRGVDEEHFNKEKQIPLHEIRRIKGAYDMMIAIAGGDSRREVQRAIFNDADIVVVWKSFYQQSKDTAALAKEFLQEIR